MEYEYSFKVLDLTPYHKYCKENDYELLEVTNQSRTLYRHINKTMARITIKECNNTIIKTLDFKEDKLSSDVLIERKESEAITFTDDAAVDSILEFLEYKKDNTLIRKRYVYKLADIKLEIGSQ